MLTHTHTFSIRGLQHLLHYGVEGVTGIVDDSLDLRWNF